MPIMIFTMVVVLVLAAAIIAVVVMGMEGTGKQQHPEIANAMARTARHLNGEGEPPKALVTLFDEIDEVPEINVRQLPGRIRSSWSARSATSAASANPPELEADANVPALGAGPAADGDDASDASWAPLDVPDTPDAERVDEDPPDGRAPALGDEPHADRTDRADRSDRADLRARIAAALAAKADDVDEDPYGLTDAPEQAATERDVSMADALAAPATDDPAGEDPYGVWGLTETDDVVHVTLPEGRRDA